MVVGLNHLTSDPKTVISIVAYMLRQPCTRLNMKKHVRYFAPLSLRNGCIEQVMQL